jgi:hypothetical protein
MLIPKPSNLKKLFQAARERCNDCETQESKLKYAKGRGRTPEKQVGHTSPIKLSRGETGRGNDPKTEQNEVKNSKAAQEMQGNRW